MAIDHKLIPDAELHEPKGAASAVSGQVYVANGSGSGVWTAFNPSVSSTVTVNSVADFPTPVANVITLADNTTYIISGLVDIGLNTFVLGANSMFLGTNPSFDRLMGTATGTVFTGTSIRINNVGLSFSSATIFSLTGPGPCVLDTCQIDAAGTLGTMDGILLFVWNRSNLTAIGTTGITFTNACRSVLITALSATNFNGTLFDFGTATFDFLQLNSNRFSPNGGATTLDIAPSSANINSGGEGWITQNLFNGVGAATIGYTPSDEAWSVHDNAGLQGSIIGASGYMLAGNVDTTISTVNTPVVADFNGNFVAGTQSQFTVSTEGRFTYNGNTDISVIVSGNALCDHGDGNDKSFRLYFAKNGVVNTGSVTEASLDSNDPENMAVSHIDSLSTGDYIEMWVENITNTENLNIETASIRIVGA